MVAMALTLFSTPSISDFIEMLMGFVSVSVCPSFVTQVLNCQRVNVPKRAEDDVFLLNIRVQMPSYGFISYFVETQIIVLLMNVHLICRGLKEILAIIYYCITVNIFL